jgi:tetratricopeptide (TPR) repeat protein
VLAFQAGRLDDQERFVSDLIQLSDEGMERFADHRQRLGRLLLPGLAAQADIALRHGQANEAIAITRRRSALAAELARTAPPSDTTFLERQVDAAISIRESLARVGRSTEAAGDLAEARAVAERLHAAEPAVFSRTQLLVNVLACQGKVAEETGDPTVALACQQRCFDLLAPWQKRDPVSQQLNVRVFGVAHNIATLSSSLGDLEGAARILEEAVSFAPDDWKPDLLVHLARVHVLQGDHAAARAAAERAIAIDKAEEARSILADLATQPD